MSKSRTPLVLGLGVAGVAGYYLYSAGGKPKAAEKKFESDVQKASAEAKSRLPGSSSSTSAEKDLQGYGAKVGQKVDNAASEVEKQASAAKSKGEAYIKDAQAGAVKAIDTFDKKVEEGSAKAKSGISGWFGGGSK